MTVTYLVVTETAFRLVSDGYKAPLYLSGSLHVDKEGIDHMQCQEPLGCSVRRVTS
jgi:uncharacterized phosphosugar-binding protein